MTEQQQLSDRERIEQNEIKINTLVKCVYKLIGENGARQRINRLTNTTEGEGD